MFVTVPKIGTGTDEYPFQPDTDAQYWRMIEDRETEMVIEILD